MPISTLEDLTWRVVTYATIFLMVAVKMVSPPLKDQTWKDVAVRVPNMVAA